jgi:hypothetical protein
MMSRTVETRIEIDASPAVVWQVLTDFPAYGMWNPFIRAVTGNLTVNGMLSFTVATGPDTTVSARARILGLDPPNRLVWGGGLPLGLFRGEHSFTIESREAGVEFCNSERFSGLLVPLTIKASRLRAQRAAFQGFDRALKVRAESLMTGSVSKP